MSLVFSTYRNITVFHPCPQWDANINGDILHQFEEIGVPYGYSYSESNQLGTRYSGKFGYIFKATSDIFSVNAVFDAARGRWGNIWFPSWIEDFRLTSDIGSTSTSLSVETTSDYSTYYSAEPGTGRHIFIFVNNGKWFARKITGYGIGSLTIDSALGETIKREDVVAVCFLYKGRFDIDEIEWKYKSPDVATCELSFIELPHEYTSTSTTTTTSSSTTTTTTA